MKIPRTVGASFAIVFGAYQVYKAFTAERFENIGDGMNPPEDERYVYPTIAMKTVMGILALAFMLLGIWVLLK
jgi:hypothetical protein